MRKQYISIYSERYGPWNLARKARAAKPYCEMTDYEKHFAFKKEYKNKSVAEKLLELVRLANTRFHNKSPYETRRFRRHPAKGKCFVCRTEMAYCQHHIIALKNGGSDTGLNRIMICKCCHEKIHPWLSNRDPIPYSWMDRSFQATFQ